MEIKKYTKTIEAVFFDGVNNAQEIADWCAGMVVELLDPNGRVRTDMYAIDIPVGNGDYTTAGADCYIIKESGYFFAVPVNEFNSVFTESA